MLLLKCTLMVLIVLLIFCIVCTLSDTLQFSNYGFFFLSLCFAHSSLQNKAVLFVFVFQVQTVGYNFLGHLCCRKIFYIIQLWQIALLGILVYYSVLVVMSFRTWDALLQALLAFKVSFEKPAVIQMGFPSYVTCMFFLLQLSNTLSLLYVFHV